MKLDYIDGACAYNRVVDDFNSAVDDFRLSEYFAGGVLIGLSGGADSALLLHLMHKLSDKYGFRLSALHLNHSIRGCEADSDMELCRRLCESIGVPIIVKTLDIPRMAAESGRGLEEEARIARYGLFAENTGGDSGLGCIVTAHNSDDNAETVIFNMLRGGGGKGMCGIPPVRGNVLRPLIYAPKSDIIGAVKEMNIPYAVDSTNSDTKYTRNYIRANIVPSMRKICAEPERKIMQMCKNLRTDMSYIDCEARRIINDNDICVTADRELLSGLHPALVLRILTYMFSAYGCECAYSLEKKHFDGIMKMLKSDKVNFSVSVPRSSIFLCERNVCRFTHSEEDVPEDGEISLKLGHNTLWNGAEIYVTKDKNDDFLQNAKNVYKLFIQATISFDTINPTLKARRRRDGDSYVFGGMTHKLKKLFNDRKIPPSERDGIPVLCDEHGIVWVPGFSVRDNSKKDRRQYNMYVYYCRYGGNNE